MIKLNKRGSIIGIIGISLIVGSIAIMFSVLPDSNISKNGDLYVPLMFEGMFNQISDDIQIFPGESGYFTYVSQSSNISILWGIQIMNYQDSDQISISISNIFGDEYGVFTQTGPVIFETLEISKSDTLYFEIQNQGSRPVTAVVMISEDPDNSDFFSNPDSPVRATIFPLVVSGILLILGIIISGIGLILFLKDWRNDQSDRANY